MRMKSKITSIHVCSQKDYTGCGIACVAAVTNRTYDEVKDALMQHKEWKRPDRNLYTWAKDLSYLLSYYSMPHEIKGSRSWDEINGVSIVGVNRDKGYFHWVVAVKDDDRFYIIDPKCGEVLSCHARLKRSYKHSERKSQYVSLGIKVKSIKFKLS